MSSSVRIPPLPFTEWTQEAREAIAPLNPARTGTPGEEQKSNLTLTLAHHPKLASAVCTFGGYLLFNSPLSPRLREIVILRVAWRYKAEYEWYQHVQFAQRFAGLTDEEIEATKQDVEAKIWCDADRCVLQVADQLCEHSKIDDATWEKLSQFLDRRQIMDLIFAVGNYVMLAWAITAFGIEVEPENRISAHPVV